MNCIQSLNAFPGATIWAFPSSCYAETSISAFQSWLGAEGIRQAFHPSLLSPSLVKRKYYLLYNREGVIALDPKVPRRN